MAWNRWGAGGGEQWQLPTPHLQPWPRAQQLGCPASSLILLSRGDPAFCQSGGSRAGQGAGRRGTSVCWRTWHNTSGPSHRPAHLTDPTLPIGEQRGEGAGVREQPQKGEESAPRRQGFITKLWTPRPHSGLSSSSNFPEQCGPGFPGPGGMPSTHRQMRSQRGLPFLIWRGFHPG